jgi:NADPH:quinone reductase-like Zn-dependent oxidoreductase
LSTTLFSPPTTGKMKAVTIKKHGVASLSDIKEQSMRPDYIKVKTVAVALNPTDAHHAASEGRVGGILGCDLSGIVEEVGEECKTHVKKGDAVYGVSHGANLVSSDYCIPREHVLTVGRMVMKTAPSQSLLWYEMAMWGSFLNI